MNNLDRSRLKILSAVMGFSMGGLVHRLAKSKETIADLEKKYNIGQ